MSLPTAAGLALLAVWLVGAYLVTRGLQRANRTLGRGAAAIASVEWPVMLRRPLNLLDVVLGRFNVEARRRALRA